MKHLYILMMMFLASLPAWAGFGDRLPIKWGRILPSEFSIQPQGTDANAPAIVLCDFGDIEITNRTFYTRHTRIKILNDAGLKYASVEIPYQTRNKHDDFYVLKARTMILDNGKIIAYAVDPGQIENVRINDRWSMKKFTFPNVKPGAIIEFYYKVASLDFAKLDTWYFQREIPTIWSELRFEVPDPFTYLVTFENNRQLDQGEELNYGEKLQWLYNTKARKRHNELAGNNYLLYATSENRYKVWAVNHMKKKIVMRNLPGLSVNYDNQPVASAYPQVRFDLFESAGNLPRSFRPLVITTHPDYETRGEWALLRDPIALSGYVHYRLDTWSEFNNELLANDRFGKYLMKSVSNKRILDSITHYSGNDLERLETVYNYVRSAFKWNGEFSMVAGQDFKDFLEKRTGSSAEINLVLVNLLRQSGIQAFPLVIRTSDRGLPERMFPVKGQFNHVIVVAVIQGKEILLDAVCNSKDLNKLHILDIGTQGWIVREDNPGWIEIFTPAKAAEEAPAFRI